MTGYSDHKLQQLNTLIEMTTHHSIRRASGKR